MKLYEYTVTGSTIFPIDMLRYDSAYPADSAGVDVIAAADPAPGRTLQVRLRSHHEPTIARWNSFTWRVGAVSKLTV